MSHTPSDTSRFVEAESDPRLPKDEAKPRIAQLRGGLLQAQYARLEQAERSLLIVVTGIDGAGKGATVNLINEWMDPRHIRTLAFGPTNEEETQYPMLWRYWRDLPAKGRTGIVFGSWYAPLFQLLSAWHPDPQQVEALAGTIREFEAMLARDGVQILKLWYHLSRDAQKARTEKLAADAETSWMVQPEDHLVAENFKRVRKAAEAMLDMTEAPLAPWHIIPSADSHVRNITTGQAILDALRAPQLSTAALQGPDTPPARPSEPSQGRLERVDYTLSLSEDEYDDQLSEWRTRLAHQVRSKAFRKQPLLLVFEGHDAAGKGSTIRRITQVLDARRFRAVPIAAPTEDERARPYLWRFWRELPAPGNITIFDRSWYGRVLVERVENLAHPYEWQRAYHEINAFESQLADSGILVLKFWLAITKDVQLERFHEREQSPLKSFKITSEDWRNREKWPAYTTAANDMFDLTDTPHAPWHVVSANDKRHARIAVLKHIVTALDERL